MDNKVGIPLLYDGMNGSPARMHVSQESDVCSYVRPLGSVRCRLDGCSLLSADDMPDRNDGAALSSQAAVDNDGGHVHDKLSLGVRT